MEICSGQALYLFFVGLADICPGRGGHIDTAKLIKPLLVISSDTMDMYTPKEGRERRGHNPIGFFPAHAYDFRCTLRRCLDVRRCVHEK